VATGRVLIIAGDEWVLTVLAKFLIEAGHDVHTAGEAREGLQQALELAPECIICDVALPDIDGFWVARRLRAESPDIGAAPFLFLTDIDDPGERLQCLLAGADLFVTKPVHHEEVAAQVGSLVGMVQRLRRQDSSNAQVPVDAAPSFTGDISLLSLPTMLSMLEMERRNGTLRISGDQKKEAIFEVVQGAVGQVTLGGKPRDPVEAMRSVLQWQKGSFAFTPGDVDTDRAQARSVGALLLEAMKREDETEL
jgi:two-component system OmpR family response regulator